VQRVIEKRLAARSLSLMALRIIDSPGDLKTVRR
jgi:hypothetical protein